MNRAVMLRFAACGTIGLGAALLIAALLLSTYTSSRITKIPLNIDTTLVSDGTGTALDSASLSGDHIVINQNVPLASQQQVTVETPANADVVTLQAGTSTTNRVRFKTKSGCIRRRFSRPVRARRQWRAPTFAVHSRHK